MTKPVRLGMVGGGPGAMIGPTHRIAAWMYGDYRLVAGAFSRTPERNRAMGEALGLATGRVYDDYREMARAESAREDGIEAVAVVTPNDSHVPISTCFLRHGIHVVCDKPLANSLADAETLRDVVEDSGCIFALTHNYAGYPMVREARARVLAGELGAVRIVNAEYASGARSRLVEAEGDEKTAWRTNPAIGGPSAVLCDLGVHAHHLLRFVTGCEVEAVSASLATVVPGRTSHDDAQVSLRLSGGARGALWASYVAAGCRNGLRLLVCGESGTLEWWQEQPETLTIHALGGSSRRLHRGDAGLSADARSATRRKPGQPEGFQEAFANVYSDIAGWIRAPADRRDRAPWPAAGVHDGIAGVRFIEACVASDRAGAVWVDAFPECFGVSGNRSVPTASMN